MNQLYMYITYDMIENWMFCGACFLSLYLHNIFKYTKSDWLKKYTDLKIYLKKGKKKLLHNAECKEGNWNMRWVIEKGNKKSWETWADKVER